MIHADDPRETLLIAVLANVAFDGWTETALRTAATSQGLDRSARLAAFPGGVPDVIRSFNDWTDARMERALGEQDMTILRRPERIALAIRLRLERLEPHREAVRLLFAHLALPGRWTLAATLAYRTVDRICYAVGDASTDFRFYAQRATLAPLLTSTMLYWIDDRSEGALATWSFLERRLHGLMAGPKRGPILGNLDRLLENLPSPRRFSRQMRRRVEEI